MMWWILLCGSALLLILVLVRNRSSRRWLGYLALNVTLALFLLYFMNLIGANIGLAIPINVITVSTIGILGVPGVLLLIALKLTLF